MTVNEIICSNIAELRKKQGLSQEELAGMLDITFQAVSKWENQLSCPDIALIPKIAEIFQVSIDFLFGKEERNTIEKQSAEWPNDNNLYAVIFQGHRILKKEELTDELSEIQLKYDGEMQGMTIKSYFSITVQENIYDSTIQSGTHITCADITDSKIESGTHITCADITDSEIECRAHITCADITNSQIESGAHITCTDISYCDSVSAQTFINAASVFQDEKDEG